MTPRAHLTEVATARRPAALALSLLVGCGGSAVAPPPIVTCAANALELQVGEAAELSAGSGCVRLAEGGSFALSWFDPLSIEMAETDPGAGSVVWPDSFSVTVGLGRPGAVSPLQVARVPPGGEVVRTAALRMPPPFAAEVTHKPPISRSVAHTCPHGDATTDPVLCRDRPWRVGETFDFPQQRHLGAVAPIPAEVVAIQGPLVFAMRPIQVASHGALVLEDLASLSDDLTQIATPLLRDAFDVDHPVTSPDAGQLLVFIKEVSASSGAGNRVLEFADPDSYRAFVELAYDPNSEELDQPLKVLVHELTHTWQGRYAWTRGDLVRPPWGSEGGADFVALEVLRERAGVAADANVDPETATDPRLISYLRTMRFTSGNINRGYMDAALLLRHLHLDARRRGVADAEVLATLLQASLEDWYGVTTASGTSVGFVSRWRALVGADWDPAVAALEYGASVAVDDRLPGARFDWPPFKDAWRRTVASDFAPLAELQTGQSFTTTRPGGSIAYVVLEAAGASDELLIEADRAGVRWLLVRFR